MAKTEKELQELKEKVEEVKKELKELSDEELEQVSGGLLIPAKGLQECIKPIKKPWMYF
jgi:bacteriocin-type signal sequence